MTIVYVPMYVKDNERQRQQGREAARLAESGWKPQGIMELRDNLNQKVTVMIFSKEE